MPNTDVMLITTDKYPALFRALELVSHDNGNQAGHKNYAISLKWEDKINVIESCLAHLLNTADSDFTTLCIGEESEKNNILRRYLPGVSYADDLLQEFFEEL